MAKWGAGVNQLDTSQTGDGKKTGFNKVKDSIADIYSKLNRLRTVDFSEQEPTDYIENVRYYDPSEGDRIFQSGQWSTPANVVMAESTGYGVIEGLSISAQNTPDMSVYVEGGIVHMMSGKRFVIAAIAALAILAADPLLPRIDRIYTNSSGQVAYAQGVAAASPVAPELPSGSMKGYQVSVAAGATSITSANITDERTIKDSTFSQYINTPKIADIITKGPQVDIRAYASLNTNNDWSVVLNYLNETLPEGSTIIFPSGSYNFKNAVNLTKELHFVAIGNVVLKYDSGYNVVACSAVNGQNALVMFHVIANNVTFDGFTFDATVAPNGVANNTVIIVNGYTGHGYKCIIKNCTFNGLPYSQTNVGSAICLLGVSTGSKVLNCDFNSVSASVFSQQSYSVIDNCTAINSKDVAFGLSGQSNQGSSITNCKVIAGTNVSSGAISAENGAGNFVIANNTVLGITAGAGIGLVSLTGYYASKGGIVKGNVVDGLNAAATSNTAAAIRIDKEYENVIVEGNIFKNCSGSSSSTVAVFAPNNLTVKNNHFINSVASYVIKTQLYDTGMLTFTDNTIDGARTATTMRFENVTPAWVATTAYTVGTLVYANGNVYICTVAGTSGSTAPSHTSGIATDGTVTWSYKRAYGAGKVKINGNHWMNTPAGINFANMLMDLEFQDDSFENCTYKITGSAPWLNYFNIYHCDSYPYKIASNVSVYGPYTIPTTGTWKTGDKIYFTNPTAGSYIGLICVTAGTPGTWKTFGVITA